MNILFYLASVKLEKIIKNRIGTNGKSANLLIQSENAKKIAIKSLAHMEKMNNFAFRIARK